MTQKSHVSRKLAAASARLLILAERGEISFAAELLRRIGAVGQNGVSSDAGKAQTDRGLVVNHARRNGTDFTDAKRMRDAIDVALALLDEMFNLLPGEPRQAAAQDIAEIFREIAEFAAMGESAAKDAMKDEDDEFHKRR